MASYLTLLKKGCFSLSRQAYGRESQAYLIFKSEPAFDHWL